MLHSFRGRARGGFFPGKKPVVVFVEHVKVVCGTIKLPGRPGQKSEGTLPGSIFIWMMRTLAMGLFLRKTGNYLNVAMRNPALFKGRSSELFYLFFICYWIYSLKSVQVAATLAMRTTSHKVNT